MLIEDMEHMIMARLFGMKDDYDGYAYNIVGHTQLEHGCGGIITDKVADLDSAEAFIINDLGEIKKYS